MNEKPSILLVDDQERNLDALEAILSSTGYELVRARSADEALLALIKCDFAAIVCDIRMPGVDGIELAEMIKRRKRSQHIPILFLTAHTIEEEDLLRGYEVGAVDYLSKPIKPEILRLKLGVFVELFRKTRALAQTNQALAEEVERRWHIQEALRIAKKELEQRVEERTAELTAANCALRESKESAERANRAKDHFLAVLSHELRTPLTPVLATVQELLRAANVAPDLREKLDMINRNIELESRLIDDLLDLTRISRGKMELQRSKVDVHHILEHALRTCDADFRSKAITVHALYKARQTHMMGDRARLLQVFWNLLKNAAKFTPSGKTVEVLTSNTPDNKLRIQVRDTGIGIESARLNSVFNAFEQGNVGITRNYGGLGLGLSIGKALVELHGGTIQASSEGIDRGSCFTVELPIEITASCGADDADGDAPGAGHMSHARLLPYRRLLLIEDHDDTSRVLQRLLRTIGYDVTTADSVTAALRTCRAAPQPFDIVISDLGLPDGSGLDFMRQFRASYPFVPAIVVSGFGMEEDRLRSLNAGFFAHLTKPIDITTLQSTIEQAIHKSSRSSETFVA